LILLLYYIDDDNDDNDDNDDTEPKRWTIVFATVSDEHETNCVSPVSTRLQPDIQSLASSALLSNQSLVAALYQNVAL
jgi:hypothetical protein